ncbi:hypothetical protein DFH06DRAFT_1147279 [Mycena polygramma]|nr:hypothetical protein DFH06DRAFT_1147279 [Mycena polygramma]
MASTTTALVGQGMRPGSTSSADSLCSEMYITTPHNHAGYFVGHLDGSFVRQRNLLPPNALSETGISSLCPRAGNQSPSEYQERGVAIGDVGTATPEGVFDFFLNVFLAPDDPIRANHTPEGFSPLALYDPIDLLHENRALGDFVSSSNVQKLDFDTLSEGGSCAAGGALLQKLRNLENMRTYAAEHADSWYKYINGARGRGISNGDLYLVTGCEKARSWGIASFRAAREEFQIFFKPTVVAGSAYGPYSWSGLHGQKNPSRRKCHNPHSTNDLANQTTFIHGLSISLPTGRWGRLFGTVQTSSILDFQSLLNAPGSSSASGPRESLFSWSLNLLSGRGASGGKQCAGEHREGVLSDLSPTGTAMVSYFQNR